LRTNNRPADATPIAPRRDPHPTMKIPPLEQDSLFAVSGHAGVGHVHSHQGFVQDDSAGFAVALELLKTSYPVNTTIEVALGNIETGEIRVRTNGGGVGVAKARRGVTPWEAELLARAVGLDCVYSQAVAFKVFGRIYGQGVLEVPVAFQAACCLAAMDTFRKAYPNHMVYGMEDIPGHIGAYMGARLNIEGFQASVLAVVNANDGGIGPDEDLEGNIMLGEKGRVMRKLGMDRLPTIIVESKAYVPAICKEIVDNHFLIRANGDVDNTIVYDALCAGAKVAQQPFLSFDTAYPRGRGEMTAATQTLAQRIVEIGNKLASETRATHKVELIAELAVVVSQDAGGVTYMSSEMHDVVAGGGLMPGTAAVLSMIVTENYIRKWKIPFFTCEDAETYIRIIKLASTILASKVNSARELLAERFEFDVLTLNSYLQR